jgi:hypothetical protein
MTLVPKRGRLCPPLRVLFLAALLGTAACEIMPRNSLQACQRQCPGRPNSRACTDFCACIHLNCQSLDSCLTRYNQASADPLPSP